MGCAERFSAPVPKDCAELAVLLWQSSQKSEKHMDKAIKICDDGNTAQNDGWDEVRFFCLSAGKTVKTGKKPDDG
ncbi:hypothetical protein H8711_09500 [Clostridiaceae bacterium NSJ-31]|uniref:Uncharacterized protein n=1 Tax=Ligaoa zhengdingensis TaxID=2763658 RepID=A0A926E103_9FIRM|nr:hypothetical protein [Ligaoa zhengdingensis]MBC8547162.1 hypothetical protein [Ligaoa zhengdingensis]